MSGLTKVAVAIFAGGSLLGAGGFLLLSRSGLTPIDQPVRLEAGAELTASFVARYPRYEIGIVTPSELVLSSRCPTSRNAVCVDGLRPTFIDQCADRPPLIELSAVVKTGGQSVSAGCLGSARERYHWQELWWIEAEPGREYELALTVAGADPGVQAFHPALRVVVDRDLRKEKGLELSSVILSGLLISSLGLALLAVSLLWTKLRSKT